MSSMGKVAGGAGRFVDDRFGVAKGVKKNLKKVFPDHWSFMMGEIALYSFIILLLSGTFLTLWFKPSMNEIVYNGSYEQLRGLKMSEAYASTLDISFDVRGGLIMRQIHHWAALLFVASICVHLFRIYFTGAFRKPREFNWLIGMGLLTLALLEGFAGYSLPDDLLSGTGLRIASGVMQSIPLVGTYLAFFVFGGEFPGEDFIPRLYTVHVLLIPGILLALIAVHVGLVAFQKHTQYPGAGRTEDNVVGYPLLPVYAAKAGGFFFVVFGITSLLSAIAVINPIWAFGPYNPSQVSAGSQPDWYIGFLEGSLRMTPPWETNLWGHTLSWNVLIPGLVLPGLMFTAMGAYPFIEAWVTGDKREHHILDRPRNVPVRTGFGVMAIVFYGILWANGGNDLIAVKFGLSINTITRAAQVLLVVLPPLSFVVTKRICMGLQRRDRDRVLHGRETGVILRLPHGEFVELHEPISAEERHTLTQHEVHRPAALEAAGDEHGIPAPHRRKARIRAALSRWYFEERIDPPTPDEARELEASHH